MELLKNWIFCIIAAAAAGTLATVIVPRGSMDKTVRAVIGMFVVAVICSPLLNIDKSDLSVEAFADFEEVSCDDSNVEEIQAQMITVFKETADRNIKIIASEFGIDVVSVNAEMFVDENGCINIHEIEISINRKQSDDIENFSLKTAEKLGIPVKITEE